MRFAFADQTPHRRRTDHDLECGRPAGLVDPGQEPLGNDPEDRARQLLADLVLLMDIFFIVI